MVARLFLQTDTKIIPYSTSLSVLFKLHVLSLPFSFSILVSFIQHTEKRQILAMTHRKGSEYAGLSVAIVTPFQDGEVDYARLREQVEFQIAGRLQELKH